MADDINFLEEIDDSLRVEKLEEFWQRSGKHVIAGCIAVVLVTAGTVLWKNHLHVERARQTGFIIRADGLAAAGKTAEAAVQYEKAEEGTRGLAVLAKLREAEMFFDAGQNDKALALYKATAADSGGDEELRDLARMRADVITENTAKGPTSFEANHTFGGFTDELAALQLVSAGKNKEARERLSKAIDDPTLPESERERSLELLDTIPEDKK